MLRKLLFGGAIVNSMMSEIVIFFVRVFTGLTMAVAHGVGKIPPSEKFVAGVESMGFPVPILFAWSAGLAEFAGGILLAIGLATRPAAASIAVTMFVAGFIRHAQDPFESQERALLFMALALIFVALGGGRWSVDRKLR